MTAPTSYDGVAKTLHWTVAGLVLMQYFTKLASPQVFAGVTERSLNAWHLAIGPTILLLMLVRLAWRLTRPTPPAPTDLPAALRLLSRAVHWAFYGLLIAIPVLGWLSASGYGAPVTLLGIVPLPALVGAGRGVGERWGDVHGWLAWAALAFVAIHVAGASYHALAKEDGVFLRMLPFGRP